MCVGDGGDGVGIVDKIDVAAASATTNIVVVPVCITMTAAATVTASMAKRGLGPCKGAWWAPLRSHASLCERDGCLPEWFGSLRDVFRVSMGEDSNMSSRRTAMAN